MIQLDTRLRQSRDAGRKLLVPYVTAGCRDDWLEIVRAVADAGADAIEIGMPFSDPVMDGPVIQEASVRALARGTTPGSIFEELSAQSVDVPLATMTYFNLVFRFGLTNFAKSCVASGISGVILPDLPLDEAGPWRDAATAAGVDTVFLVAPNTRDARLQRVVEASSGFVYAIGTLGVTGERSELATSAIDIGKRAKAVTDTPVLVGVGVSTPEQAVQASEHADGVVMGSALVRRIIDGASPMEIGQFVGDFRRSLDG